MDEELLSRQIFSLGEVAQICPHRINRRMFLLMQSIIFQSHENMKIPENTATNTIIVPGSQTQVRINKIKCPLLNLLIYLESGCAIFLLSISVTKKTKNKFQCTRSSRGKLFKDFKI